jgi:hypothetical protein
MPLGLHLKMMNSIVAS